MIDQISHLQSSPQNLFPGSVVRDVEELGGEQLLRIQNPVELEAKLEFGEIKES